MSADEIDSLQASRSRDSLPVLVANSIRGDIIRGRLDAGDRLPTEQELAQRHAVSRVVIREAIARLRQEGLVMSRQGLGVFVASPGERHSLVLEPERLKKPEDYRHLYELRLIIEGGAAELAARNHTEDDVAELAQCLTEIAEAKADQTAHVTADLKFHRAIAAASKNPFVSLFISFVDGKLKESISLALKGLDLPMTAETTAHEHEAVFKAIRARDVEAAGDAMRLHLQNSSQRLGLSVSARLNAEPPR